MSNGWLVNIKRFYSFTCFAINVSVQKYKQATDVNGVGKVEATYLVPVCVFLFVCVKVVKGSVQKPVAQIERERESKHAKPGKTRTTWLWNKPPFIAKDDERPLKYSEIEWTGRCVGLSSVCQLFYLFVLRTIDTLQY